MSMLDDPTRLLPGGSELLARLAKLESRVAILEVQMQWRLPHRVRWDRYGHEWRNYGQGWLIRPQDSHPWTRKQLERRSGPTVKRRPDTHFSAWK